MLVLPRQPQSVLRHFEQCNVVSLVVRFSSRPQRPSWSASLPCLSGAAAAASIRDLEQPVAGGDTSGELQLPKPSTAYQKHLTSKERATHRACSEILAKEKKLQRLQVGTQGITINVLRACMDVLMKHEYLRVKLGEGCGLDRKQTAALLADLLDAAVVGQVGFTITLYRTRGLPRPDNLATAANSP